ncbi:mucin-2 isoform X2 [Agrilus planipennis]|uniref:Mucin-2 isoform X2 n=1 Tax=Agrilus planipennis TaxID=224129 RepID=A0A7F5R1Y5_AGRPL|nr:mucin-2 isoform X2 [Agrilus planipennis]
MAKWKIDFTPYLVSIVLLTVIPGLVAADQNLVTQTVYGFLDFTTTIGNTVMVFSPQSADSAASEKSKPSEPNVNTVIETKPIASTPPESSPVITPSKTEEKEEKKSSEFNKKKSTVVDAKSNAPAHSKSEPKSKVNVVHKASSSVVSAVNIVNAVTTSPPEKKSVITKVEVVGAATTTPLIVSSKVEIQGPTSHVVATPVIGDESETSSDNEKENEDDDNDDDDDDDEPAVILQNNIGEPEYDFLSRQPSEFVEETYKVINLKPSSKFQLKHRPSGEAKTKQASQPKKTSASIRPTGLVTKLGGTVVKDGVTTVHETSVIGTYISGKYAQVLQSSSSVVNGKQPKGKINPSPTLKILKTAAASLGKGNKQQQLEPTPVVSVETALPVEGLFNGQNSIRQTRKTPASSTKSRFKNRPKEKDAEPKETVTPQPPKGKKTKPRTTPAPKGTNEQTTHTPSTTASSGGRKYQSRKNKPSRISTTTPTTETTSSGFSRRGFKPKIQPSSVEPQSGSPPSSVYKFKLNRAPGRWQYKTTAKPRVTIRKQNDDTQTNGSTTEKSPQDPNVNANDVNPSGKADEVDSLEGSESVASIIDDENSTENKIDSPLPVETIKVEISTPPDFKDTYYEIATIKSPYIFQAGGLKNTRYITVTSTFEKLLEPTPTEAPSLTATEPLTENILATTSYNDKDGNFLDSSIATLPPLYVASDMETPPLETKTETFSTTQTMLKTHILPAVREGNQTSTYTLIQTYLITRIVTATKTLPPMEAYHFNPSRTLNEFNSHLDEAGSELNLDIAFGDEESENSLRKSFQGDLDLANVGSDFSLSDIDKAKLMEAHLRAKKLKSATPKPEVNLVPTPNPALNPDQLQQLALLRFLNPAAAVPQGQIITTSKPVIKLETVYESHVIPIFNGQSTILTTVSKVLGTVTRTDYELGTSTIAAPVVPALPTIAPVNPLFPQQQQPQFTVTSSPIVQNTVLTQTDSKVLKLTFGAKTAYTTIFSTKIVPTMVTTYMTASVPVQPTAAFPGFFPAPYPPFPYLG